MGLAEAIGEAGYANGPDKAPTYQQVCSDSGHAETVRIDYDPDRMPIARMRYVGHYSDARAVMIGKQVIIR